MAGLVLRTASASSESVEFVVELDGAEPFLAHHCPGGHPLFATVMGLELMARAVGRFAGASPAFVTQASQIVVLDPIIVTDHSTTAYVHVTRSITKAAETFDAHIETRGTSVVRHLSARLDRAEPKSRPTANTYSPTDLALPVRANDIYALFFHGPAFQVLKAAGLADDAVFAEVATDLPNLTSDPINIDVLAPRLIEACLQTAGLLEVATRSRMMIPSRIERFAFVGDQALRPDRLFTRARRSVASHGVDAVDIDLVDADGSCWLQVIGYQTLPLPFASDSAAIDDLNQAFRRTAS